MYNSYQRSMVTSISKVYFRPQESQSHFTVPNAPQLQCYRDALAAKQQALKLLQFALDNIALSDIDVILAVVLLFIESELIETGRDNWRHHVIGARAIIEKICGSNLAVQSNASPLRTVLISNYLVFDIIGSTLTGSSELEPMSTLSSNEPLSLLQDAEGNHCSSFPIALLRLIQIGAQLSSFNCSRVETEYKRQQALDLLQKARSFDPIAWATNIQPVSPAADLIYRTHLGNAHRAAVCIYLSRILLSMSPNPKIPHDFEPLVAEIITHLSYIRPDNALFTAITWPAFVAGAETDDASRQVWVAEQFQELWEVEPWGTIRGALGVLGEIWQDKRDVETEEGTAVNGRRDGNWIRDLKERDVGWLIL